MTLLEDHPVQLSSTAVAVDGVSKVFGRGPSAVLALDRLRRKAKRRDDQVADA